MKNLIVSIITFYQKIVSPLFGPACRFIPTCSQYSKEAVIKHGIFKGLFFSMIRLLKCHPFHSGGYDPVP